MLIKTVLNRLECFKSFVFGTITMQTIKGSEAVVVEIKARANSKPECPECGKLCKTYDTRSARMFEYAPLWAFKVFFQYVPRRVICPINKVRVEYMPWVSGKEQTATRSTWPAGRNGCHGKRLPTFSRPVGKASIEPSSVL